MARLLLGVSGGIAAYKALELVRLATAAGHAVRVIQTPASTRFVGKASFAALTGAPVLVDEFERDPLRGAFPGDVASDHDPLSHLELVARADVMLIAPASANTLAKLAHGHADNLLTTAALAATCPLLLAPAMNNHMYEHPATRANLELLRSHGAVVIEPDSGSLASKGESGVGRLPAPERLLAAVEQALRERAAVPATAPAATVAATGSGPWSGLHVLVSAGGTREPIDSVRFVGNRSSGRMGLALAVAAQARGARVMLVAANVRLAYPDGVEVVEVATAAELQAALQARFGACDVLLMAAAVADFRPTRIAAGKIKKAGRERLELELEATPDVVSVLAAQRRSDQTLVGFAAEHGDSAVEQGRQKLSEKGLDAVVVNDIARADIGFEVDANEVTIVTADGERRVARAAKADVAEAILDVVADLRARAPAR